jgi:hypothetical protein
MNVNIRNRKGQTAIMLAAKNGNAGVMKAPLQCDGINTESKDKTGKSVEAYVCRNRQDLIGSALKKSRKG